MTPPRLSKLTGGLTLLISAYSHGANAPLQDFFFAACTTATGVLASRCAETNGGLGNLSGDSESSLNPSQSLAAGISGEGASRLREQRLNQGETNLQTDSAGERVDLGPFSLLFNAKGATESYERTVDLDAEREYDTDTQIIQAGLDYRVTDRLVVGALAHWQSATLDFARERPGVGFTPAGRAGEVTADALGVSFFGSVSIAEQGYLEVVGGYLATDADIERRALFQESNRVAPTTAVVTRGSVEGSEWFAGVHWGHSFQYRSWQFGPLAGIDHLARETDSYRERDLTGSGLALQVSDTSFRETRLLAGWRTSLTLSGDGYILMPQLDATYVRHLNQDRVSATFSFIEDAGSARLNLRGDRRDAAYYELGVGIAALFPGGWTAFAQWRAVAGREDYDRSSIALGLRLEL